MQWFSSFVFILSRSRGVTIDGVEIVEWIYWPLVCTTRSYSLQITGTYRLVTTVYYIIHQPFPGNGFCRGRFFSFLHSGLLVTAARAEFKPTDNSNNCFPGWRPFHTNLLVFTSQADSQVITDNWQLNSFTHQPASSRHFTQLNCWQLSTSTPELYWPCL
jgi:hypothetical protein